MPVISVLRLLAEDVVLSIKMYQIEFESKPNSISSPIQYRVQIAASKKELNFQEERWRNLPYIVEVVWEKEMHKYQIRNLNSFEHADRVRIQMLHKGFMGAFIVAYKDGRKLTSRELSELR